METSYHFDSLPLSEKESEQSEMKPPHKSPRLYFRNLYRQMPDELPYQYNNKLTHVINISTANILILRDGVTRVAMSSSQSQTNPV